MKTRLLKSQAEAEELNQSQSVGNEHSDWFFLLLLLPTPTIWFSQDHERRNHKRSLKKMETFDSSDSDSAALMTLLTTPFFDFHLVISALATSHYDSDSDSVASEN